MINTTHTPRDKRTDQMIADQRRRLIEYANEKAALRDRCLKILSVRLADAPEAMKLRRGSWSVNKMRLFLATHGE